MYSQANVNSSETTAMIMAAVKNLKRKATDNPRKHSPAALTDLRTAET